MLTLHETTTKKTSKSPTGWCYFMLPGSHGNLTDIDTVFATKISTVASQPGTAGECRQDDRDTPSCVFSTLKLLCVGELRDTHGELSVCSCLKKNKKKNTEEECSGCLSGYFGKTRRRHFKPSWCAASPLLQAPTDCGTPGLLHGLERLCPQP